MGGWIGGGGITKNIRNIDVIINMIFGLLVQPCLRVPLVHGGVYCLPCGRWVQFDTVTPIFYVREHCSFFVV